MSDGFRAWRLERPAPATDAGPSCAPTARVPSPGPGEVLIAVHACAVCRTDLQLAEGDLAARRLPSCRATRWSAPSWASGPG